MSTWDISVRWSEKLITQHAFVTQLSPVDLGSLSKGKIKCECQKVQRNYLEGKKCKDHEAENGQGHDLSQLFNRMKQRVDNRLQS
jgi:hypothetical protein